LVEVTIGHPTKRGAVICSKRVRGDRRKAVRIGLVMEKSAFFPGHLRYTMRVRRRNKKKQKNEDLNSRGSSLELMAPTIKYPPAGEEIEVEVPQAMDGRSSEEITKGEREDGGSE